MKWNVILHRMPHRENKIWEDNSHNRAVTRANALASLHGDCDINYDVPSKTFTVFTGEWYSPKSEAVMSESWRGE